MRIDHPRVSVVVPVRNEQNSIRMCVERLFGQTYPADRFEVIAVDGQSDDGTRQIVERFVLDNKVTEPAPVVRLIDNPNGQRASAMNIGIKEAAGDVIIRVDARTVIPANYVEKCVETLIRTGADNVGGVQRPIVSKNAGRSKELKQKAIGLAQSHPFGVGDAQFRLGKKSGYVDTVYLGCFRKEIFDKVGLFDEDAPVISEDADMNFRIRKAGGKVYLNKDIIAYYYPRDNFADLWKLYFRYGGAKAGNLLKHGVLRWRQFVCPLFLVTLAALLALSLFDVIFLWAFLGVFGLYIGTDLLVSLSLALREHSILLFPRLLLAFPCMHFAWGLGFLKRLLTKPKRGTYWKY